MTDTIKRTDRFRHLASKIERYGASESRSIPRSDLSLLLAIAQCAKELRSEDRDQNPSPCPIMKKNLRDKLDAMLKVLYA